MSTDLEERVALAMTELGFMPSAHIVKSTIAIVAEECAKIAEELKTLDCWLPTGDEPGKGEQFHATIHGKKIADAIRAVAPKETP